jgi:hypothetical protein
MKHETNMPHCWCNPIKKVFPNGNMQIIHNMNINEIIEKAQDKSKNHSDLIRNDFPMMTHNIDGINCNGLSDCLVHLFAIEKNNEKNT